MHVNEKINFHTHTFVYMPFAEYPLFRGAGMCGPWPGQEVHL